MPMAGWEYRTMGTRALNTGKGGRGAGAGVVVGVSGCAFARQASAVVAAGTWVRALGGRQTACLHHERGAGGLGPGAAACCRGPVSMQQGVRGGKEGPFQASRVVCLVLFPHATPMLTRYRAQAQRAQRESQVSDKRRKLKEDLDRRERQVGAG